MVVLSLHLHRRMHMFFKRVIWFLASRCFHCGGEVEEHINGKSYCNDCSKRQ